MWKSALRKSLISVFHEFLAGINKLFDFAGGLGTRLLFYEVYTLSRCFLIYWDPKSCVVRELFRKLVYAMFISDNRTSFHLWWKDNLAKHQKVLKYYETDFLQIVLMY